MSNSTNIHAPSSCGNGYEPMPTVDKMVEHPSHYGGKHNQFEAIKIIEGLKLGFHLGNVIKYIVRSGIKNPSKESKIQDLKKAVWYLERYISLQEKK